MTLPTPSQMVTFTGVSKHFPASGSGAAFTALDGIDYSVAKGSITVIIGRSGAGKSTLIRLVNGLEHVSSGKVLVDGIDVGALDEAGLRTLRRSIGMIFQHFNLLSSRTVFDNVGLPLEIAGVGKAEIEKRVRPLLDLVGLADKHARYPSELSAARNSASALPGRLRPSPSCCSRTRQPRRSTRKPPNRSSIS